MQFNKQVQAFQEIRKFAHIRIDSSPVYKEISQELNTIGEYINANKLTIQIFSQFPPLSQGIYNFLSSNQSLQQFYQVTISEFPKISSKSPINSPPTLILKSNPTNGQQETRYQLSPNQQILIGRDYQRLSQDIRGQNSQLIVLSGYSKISSVHAQIQNVNSPESNYLNWQICDLNATNGTYINGDRIQGCRILNPGDRITLAYPSPSEKAAEFIFHCPPNSSTNNNQELEKLIESNIIFLVVTHQQLITASEYLLIDLVSKAQISGFILIVDTSGANEQIIKNVDSELANLHNLLTVKYPLLSNKYLLTKLPLYSFYQQDSSTPLHPTIQQQFERLYSILMNLTQNKDEIIFSQVNSKLNVQIFRIEELINQQETTLKKNIQRTEELLQYQSIDDWREQVRKAFNRVREEKSEIFNYSNNNLRRSSTDFIAPFISGSFLQKLKLFIDKLNPVVTNQDGNVGIELQSEMNLNTHEAILQFCKDELTSWVDQEWNRISHGLNSLNQNSYMTLNCLPSLKLKNSFNPIASKINIQESLQVSFVEIQNSMSFQDAKHQNDNSANLLMFGSQIATVAIMAAIQNPMAIIQGVGLARMLMTFRGTNLNREQLQTLKLDQTVDNLKQNLFNFYQGIARYMLDRVIQDMNTTLVAEDKQFRKSLEAIEEQFNTYFNEIKRIIEGYRIKQHSLTQERILLDQIKQLERV